MSKKNHNICVLGAGLWGTVLANHLAKKSFQVRLWEFFPELARNLESGRAHPHIPNLELSRNVRVTCDIRLAARAAGVILVVVPSNLVRGAVRKLRGLIGGRGGRPYVVNAAKGLEPGTLKTMGEVIEGELPELAGRVYTLSGPSFAREVARGAPTKLVLAGPGATARRSLRRIFEGRTLKIETNPDRKGVELSGSLKNVLAVGCGMLDGMKAGANTKAAFLTAGIAEMGRLIRTLGGKEETIYGLSGIGDLIATGTSPESRNRSLGEKLGAGKGLRAAMKEIPTVMEGVDAALGARALARSRKIKAPLLEAVWRVIHKGETPRIVLKAMGFD